MSERSVVVRLRAEVADFKRQLGEATRAVEGVGKKSQESAAQASTAAGRMVQSASRNRQAWDQAGRTLLGFGTVTVGALGLAAKAAVDWETAWTGVLKTVDGTPEQLDAVEGGLRELARTLPSTHDEIAAVAEAAGQLGVKTKDVVGFTKVMIDLGETTNLTADEAATAIAQLMNVMGTLPQDVGRVGAALVALGNDGASTERDIIQMAQRIASAGKLIGLTEGEVLGLANALASVGIEVEAGGSAISRVLTDIAKAVSQGGDDLRSWAQVAGVTADEFAAKWKADPAEALLLFTEGLGRMHTAGQDVFTTLEDLGQSDIRTSRALLSMAANTDLARESVELGNVAFEEQTALLEEAEKRYDTTAAKVEIARNSINDAAITLGETFIPVIAAVSEQVADMAQGFADLPGWAQGATAGLAGVAGVTAFVAGGFLLTFPRVMETVQAFKALQQISPRVATSLGKVGKAAGLAGAVLAVVTIGEQITASMGKAAESVEETTKALLEMEDLVDLDALFAGSSSGMIELGKGINTLEDAINRVVNPSFMDRVNDASREIGSFGSSEGALDRDAIVKQFNAIGESLAYLVQSGHAEKAAELATELETAWAAQGGKAEDLAGLIPAYTDAVAGAENEQKLAAESTDDLTEAYNSLTGATEQLTEEQVKWREELAGINAAFVEPLAAYDALIEKNQAAAQAAADSTESTSDSWEDFVDQFPETVEGYLDELQRMVDAQTDWETNMLLLSGRVSQGTLDELARMGPEGAPLVAQLVDASDEELARMEALFGQRTEAATGQFATTLDTAAPIIAAASAQLGEGAAAEIAAKLAAGTHTVEQIMREYELEIEGIDPTLTVSADTAGARGTINEFIREQSGRTIRVHVATDRTSLVPVTGPPVTKAFGGPIFGPGTETSDSIPALLSRNEHVWSAAEVKGAGGHAAVASLRAAARDGALPVTSVMRFANGGSPAWTTFTPPSRASSAPHSVEVVGTAYNGPVYVTDPDVHARRNEARLYDALTAQGVIS